MIFKVKTSVVDYILDKYEQIDIFAHYLSITASDIHYCIDNKNKKIKNPLRPDEHPSLGFQYNIKGRLIMRDFANSFYTGDCFHIVGIVLGLNCNIPNHFIKICNDIDVNVNKNTPFNTIRLLESNPIAHSQSNTDIDVTYREVNAVDVKLFAQFEITSEQITTMYNPVQSLIYTVNDYTVENYIYDRRDPCYAIKLGFIDQEFRYKFYFPNRRTGKKPRFRTNYTLNIEDVKSIGRNKNLIIQKALKDELCLKNFLTYANITNTDIIRLSSESVVLTKFEMNVLKSRYTNILTMFDNDRQGNLASTIYLESYNFIPIYMTDLLKLSFNEMQYIINNDRYDIRISKNISDFRAMYGKDQTTILIQTLIKTYL